MSDPITPGYWNIQGPFNTPAPAVQMAPAIVYVNGARYRVCHNHGGGWDGRCGDCGGRIESSGGYCGRLTPDREDTTDA